MADPCIKLKSLALAVAEKLHGVLNSKNGSLDPDHAPFREYLSSAGSVYQI